MSLVTVTPMAILVKGPFALSSLMTAILLEGELATNIVADKILTATFSMWPISLINGMMLAK